MIENPHAERTKHDFVQRDAHKTPAFQDRVSKFGKIKYNTLTMVQRLVKAPTEEKRVVKAKAQAKKEAKSKVKKAKKSLPVAYGKTRTLRSGRGPGTLVPGIDSPPNVCYLIGH